jgi:hypothetical protein
VTPKEALARYFEQQSKWRQERAAEHPDDARNQRSAAALGELAGLVRFLPDDHPCVEAIYVYDRHFLGRIGESGLESGSASYPAARIGFGTRAPIDPKRELGRYVEQGLADQLQHEGVDSPQSQDLRDARAAVRAWMAAEGYLSG